MQLSKAEQYCGSAGVNVDEDALIQVRCYVDHNLVDKDGNPEPAIAVERWRYEIYEEDGQLHRTQCDAEAIDTVYLDGRTEQEVAALVDDAMAEEGYGVAVGQLVTVSRFGHRYRGEIVSLTPRRAVVKSRCKSGKEWEASYPRNMLTLWPPTRRVYPNPQDGVTYGVIAYDVLGPVTDELQ